MKPRKSKQKQQDDPNNNPERMFHYFYRISRDTAKTDLERFRARIDCMDLIWYLGYWPDPTS
jgi:hypothetical protein